MVALKNLMPEKPEDRNAVEAMLRDNPRIAGFIERLNSHVRATYMDVDVSVESLHYDEWDPPILIVTTASIPDREYIHQLHELRKWAKSDPDYDATKVHVSLLPRVTSQVS